MKNNFWRKNGKGFQKGGEVSGRNERMPHQKSWITRMVFVLEWRGTPGVVPLKGTHHKEAAMPSHDGVLGRNAPP